MKEGQETDKTSLNYMVNFYALVQQLINGFSEYEELILQTVAHNDSNPDEKMDIKQLESVKTYNAFLRKVIAQIQIHYSTLEYKKGTEKEPLALDVEYNKLTENYLLDRKQLRKYIVELNKYSLDRIMPHISNNADMNNIYT